MQPLELEVEKGPAAGLRLSLAGDWTIGSAEADAAVLKDRWLSPQHARIEATEAGAWQIEDLRSVEGTRVNGELGRESRTLQPGDRVDVGSTRLYVLPHGATSIADTATGRANTSAATLKAESRRGLDGRRLGAYVADSLLILPVYLLLRENGTLVAALISAALALTYFFVLESLTGQTLGKALFGLRVVRVDGRPLAAQHVSIRTVLRLIDEIALGLVGMLIMVLSGGRRRRLGDFAAGTCVTRASFSPERTPLAGRNLLAFVGYPMVWIAPAILAFVLLPGARLRDCYHTGIATGPAKEGSCIDTDGRILTVANAGNTLHMPDFDVRLEDAQIERVNVRELAGRPGFEDGVAAIVELKMAVTNKTAEKLAMDTGGREARLLVPVPGMREALPVVEIPPRMEVGSKTPFGKAHPFIAPGTTTTGWVRFGLPQVALPYITEVGSDLEVLQPGHDGGGRYKGHIRLWRASTVKGGAAIAQLQR